MNEILVEYFHVITDPAHLMAEGTYALVEFSIATILAWLGLRKRDKRHGHKEK